MAQRPEGTAIDFCASFHPIQITLTAINPSPLVKENPITTRTFYSNQRTQMAKFLKSHELHNIYFSVNTNKKLINKKPKKNDVSTMNWLHCDIDPPKTLTNPEEAEAFKKTALAKINALENQPSLVIDSGNGYQIFYKLKDPIIIKDQQHYEDLERYNQQLIIELEGDEKCFNIDRIMRVPGTTNHPTAVKAKLGRIKCEATIVYQTEETYTLRQFIQAPQQSSAPTATQLKQIKLETGNLKPVDLDDLKTPSYVKELIINGVIKGNEDKYESRSEAVFHVVCKLLRHKASPEDIAWILLNREFKISESILEASRPDKHIKRLITRATEANIDPMLEQFNSRYFIVMRGNKGKVVQEYRDYLGKLVIDSMSGAEFNMITANKFIQTSKKGEKLKFAPASKWWLAHPERKEYNEIVFRPEGDVPGCFNLWKGFSCEAVSGDWSLWKNHIENILCKGIKEQSEYIYNWMARAVQYPARPGEVALVFKGKKGTGKTIFAKAFGSLMNDHFVTVVNGDHLTGKFNSHLERAVIVLADEALWAGDKKHEGVIKNLITGNTINIERKGFDSFESPNYIHLIMASNEKWVAPHTMDERRFFTVEVSEEMKQNHKYFDAMTEQMNNGGREAMLHDLLKRDLSNFKVREVPRTEEASNQVQYGFPRQIQFLVDCLDDGKLLPQHKEWVPFVSRQAFQDSYRENVRSDSRSTKTDMTEELKKFIPGIKVSKYIVDTFHRDGTLTGQSNAMCYIFPESLEDCRKAFNQVQGFDKKWFPINIIDQEEM